MIFISMLMNTVDIVQTKDLIFSQVVNKKFSFTNSLKLITEK